MERLKVLMDYGDGDITYIGRKDNNGEFDWYPVIRLQEKTEGQPGYWIDLLVVSPDETPDEEKRRAFECCSLEHKAEHSEDETLYALITYGIYARVWGSEGTNKQQLMKEARRELSLLRMLFGFYMDRPVNRIGASGWDAIRGDIIPSFA